MRSTQFRLLGENGPVRFALPVPPGELWFSDASPTAQVTYPDLTTVNWSTAEDIVEALTPYIPLWVRHRYDAVSNRNDVRLYAETPDLTEEQLCMKVWAHADADLNAVGVLLLRRLAEFVVNVSVF